MRQVIPGLLLVVFVACTGGGGPIDQTGNGSSGSITSSSGGSSSGESTGGGGGGSGGGGTNTTVVEASDFSQACTVDTDCVAIYEGAVCSACKCPNAAISKDAVAEYGAKFQEANCPTTDVACQADCAQATPSCAQGTCTITR